MSRLALWWLSAVVAALLCAAEAAAQSPAKLKVYVLVGQSNMQGHAKVATFDYLADDPATAPLLQKMRDTERSCARVWISYLTGGRGGDGVVSGRLDAGFGARRDPQQDDGKIGPELTFGIRVAEAHQGPVLLIKCAWGGKSLHTDFRPPSAGPYAFTEQQLAQFRKQGKDLAQIRADKVAATGVYYRKTIEHVRSVLRDPGRVCPDYDPEAGYELAGVVWFQGWNDMVDRGTYPRRDVAGGYDRYTACLAHLVRDMRRALDAPGLPFAIGVMGVDGPIAPADRERRRVHANFRAAMAAVAELPEFRGNVVAVETAPFWDAKLQGIAERLGRVRHLQRMLRTKHKDYANKDGAMSAQEQREYVAAYKRKLISEDEERIYARGASNAAYHYLGCAKTMAQIGVAFADALLALQR